MARAGRVEIEFAANIARLQQDSSYYAGNLDDVRFYDRKLTGAQLVYLAAGN